MLCHSLPAIIDYHLSGDHEQSVSSFVSHVDVNVFLEELRRFTNASLPFPLTLYSSSSRPCRHAWNAACSSAVSFTLLPLATASDTSRTARLSRIAVSSCSSSLIWFQVPSAPVMVFLAVPHWHVSFTPSSPYLHLCVFFLHRNRFHLKQQVRPPVTCPEATSPASES